MSKSACKKPIGLLHAVADDLPNNFGTVATIYKEQSAHE